LAQLVSWKVGFVNLSGVFFPGFFGLHENLIISLKRLKSISMEMFIVVLLYCCYCRTHIAIEKERKGPGEQGKAFRLTDPEDIRKNNELNSVNGYWAVASDLISVNRSIADIRHPLLVLQH
jgi:hypothetical protein